MEKVKGPKAKTKNARLSQELDDIVKKHGRFQESVSQTIIRVMKEGLEYDARRTKTKDSKKNPS